MSTLWPVIAVILGFLVLGWLSRWLARGWLSQANVIKSQLKAMGDPVDGTLRVVKVNNPPDWHDGSTSCTLEGVIQAPGVQPRPVQWSGVAPNAKWPEPGQDLPVTVDRDSPDQWLMRWDRVPTRSEQGMAAAQQLASQLGDQPEETP